MDDQVWMIRLVSGRSYSSKLTGSLIRLNLVEQHKIPDLAATAEGLGKHLHLYFCWV